MGEQIDRIISELMPGNQKILFDELHRLRAENERLEHRLANLDDDATLICDAISEALGGSQYEGHASDFIRDQHSDYKALRAELAEAKEALAEAEQRHCGCKMGSGPCLLGGDNLCAYCAMHLELMQTIDEADEAKEALAAERAYV